jgi:hypothetical protein
MAQSPAGTSLPLCYNQLAVKADNAGELPIRHGP